MRCPAPFRNPQHVPASLPPRAASSTPRIELFYDEGIRSVGIDRLIGASTVTKATFYKHYGSKDRLVTEYVYHRHRTRGRARLGARRGPRRPRVVHARPARLALDQVNDPGFRGCPFLKAASEFTDPTHPVRRAVEIHREWTNFFIAELLRAIGHPLPGEAADDLTLALDGAMSGAYAGDPIAATTALQRAFERVMSEAKSAA